MSRKMLKNRYHFLLTIKCNSYCVSAVQMNVIEEWSKSPIGIRKRTSEWQLVPHCVFPWEISHKGIHNEPAWFFLPRASQFRSHPLFLGPGNPILCTIPSRCAEWRWKPREITGWYLDTHVHSMFGGSNGMCLLLSNEKCIPLYPFSGREAGIWVILYYRLDLRIPRLEKNEPGKVSRTAALCWDSGKRSWDLPPGLLSCRTAQLSNDSETRTSQITARTKKNRMPPSLFTCFQKTGF